MATTNTCKKCGCEDSFMPSPAPCPTPIGCPTPEPCSEVFDSKCVVYTGTPAECGRDTVVNTNDTTEEALANIVTYFCNRLIVPSDITCGDDLVVEAGTIVTNALINIVDYFCNNTPVQTCPPQVSIIRSSIGVLTATASGGSGSFSFQWEFSSTVNGISNMYIIEAVGTSPTTSNMTFSPTLPTVTVPIIQTANGYDMHIGLAKVIVTDINTGCVVKDTYLVIDLVANA